MHAHNRTSLGIPDTLSMRTGAYIRSYLGLAIFGAALTAACSVSVTLSAISYLSLDSRVSTGSSSGGFTAEPAWPGGPTIAQLFDSPDPGALVAPSAPPFGNGSSDAAATVDLRIAFGSKYAADGRCVSMCWLDPI